MPSCQLYDRTGASVAGELRKINVALMRAFLAVHDNRYFLRVVYDHLIDNVPF